MPDLPRIRAALAGHDPELRSAPNEASVAVVLRPRAERSPEVLFIERARKEGDPWSGHMAFPGGRREPGDSDLRVTAERETLEEVGVDLSSAEWIGRLDDLEGRHAGRPNGMTIAAHVFELHGEPSLAPNHEVHAAFWFPFTELVTPERHVGYPIEIAGRTHRFPGIRVGEPESQIVWGLTYRFLEHFCSLVGHPIPDRWGNVLEAVARAEAES